MRARTIGLLAGGGVALTALALVGQRTSVARPTAGTVTVNGVTLVSQAITLPDDGSALPAGPHADLVTANCTACHSASMILAQPRLTADQWQAEVTKMREAYKAPVPDGDVPTILAYLQKLPGQGGGKP